MSKIIRVFRSNSIMTPEAREAVRRDHPYLGTGFFLNGREIQVHQDFANSNRVSRKHLQLALDKLSANGSLHGLLGRNTITVEIDQVVDEVRCFPTSDDDPEDCFYAPRRDIEGRFNDFRRWVITNRSAVTKRLTLVFVLSEFGVLLRTGYPGDQCVPMPGRGATLEECKWWYDPETGKGHAFKAKRSELVCTDPDVRYPHEPGKLPVVWTYPSE